MASRRVVVIGAGVGGLAAAADLARRGLSITVLERQPTVGGKLRETAIGGTRIDSGPTVLTMRWVLEELFADAGEDLAGRLTLRPAETLARHAWGDGTRLDLFADVGRSTEAIGAFAGAAEARAYAGFCARAEQIYRALERPFVRAPLPTPLSLARAVGISDLARIMPLATMARAIAEHFRDPRLRQLFGRYATYCGASPFLAPATLMMVAHVGRSGVWLVDGGMQRIAEALSALAQARGASVRTGAAVAEILVTGGRARGVRLVSGERIAADAVVANADAAALAAGKLGPAAAAATPRVKPEERSLSAVTWAMTASAEGFPLSRHTVFFSRDDAAEFDALFNKRQLPGEASVYVCAQDRTDTGPQAPAGPERLLLLINAPAAGDSCQPAAQEIARCETTMFALLTRCGLRLTFRPETVARTTPTDFERLFPGTGGALYGPATHGAMASFRRAGSRTKIAGLYLAGGGTHPGAGLPMAILSGRLAAASLLADQPPTRASTVPSRPMATPGGMSTG